MIDQPDHFGSLGLADSRNSSLNVAVERCSIFPFSFENWHYRWLSSRSGGESNQHTADL
jgi:hypothetical protein